MRIGVKKLKEVEIVQSENYLVIRWCRQQGPGITHRKHPCGSCVLKPAHPGTAVTSLTPYPPYPPLILTKSSKSSDRSHVSPAWSIVLPQGNIHMFPNAWIVIQAIACNKEMYHCIMLYIVKQTKVSHQGNCGTFFLRIYNLCA